MVWRDSKPTWVQTWWDSVDMTRNIMDGTIFRERLHGVIVPWLLCGNMWYEQCDRNIEYVPWSLFPCKWFCHRCYILLRWTPLFRYPLAHPMAYPFSLSVLYLPKRRPDELKTPSDEISESLALYTLAQIRAQSLQVRGYMEVPPIPFLFPVTWYRSWILIGYWYSYISETFGFGSLLWVVLSPHLYERHET